MELKLGPRSHPVFTDFYLPIFNSFCLVLTGMGRPKLPPGQRKQKVTITPDPAVLAFIDERIGLGKPFKDRTHAFEFAVARLMEEEKKRAAG
jgi:hypothetical protein